MRCSAVHGDGAGVVAGLLPAVLPPAPPADTSAPSKLLRVSRLLHAAALRGSCALLRRHIGTCLHMSKACKEPLAKTKQPLKACHLLQAWRRAYKQYTKGVISAETLAEVTASCKVQSVRTFKFMTSKNTQQGLGLRA